MTSTQRAVILAVVVAIVIGIAIGWLAKTWSEPTIEERVHDTAKGAQERLRDFAR